MGEVLWRPSDAQVASTQFEQFRRKVAADLGRTGEGDFDSAALHRWSIENPGPFWQKVWQLGEVIGEPGDVAFDPVDGTVRRGRFFPSAQVCMAENLLAARDGAGDNAIVACTESGSRRVMTWEQLRAEVAALAAALRADGVAEGDRVAAYMPHVIETIVTFLAANAIGATFTSTSSDFGTAGVVDRFGQTQPTVLVAADGYEYGGKQFECISRLGEIVPQVPSIRRTVVVPVIGAGAAPSASASATPSITTVDWADYLAPHRATPLEFTRMPGDHPAYILYSSGTTGKPKCITHRSLGVLLMHLKEQQLQN
ncbi:MAG: AMP-binding protein, partial [Ilumatobacteraceae bacterium]